MTDFGEAITFDISVERHDPDCYFCNAKKEGKEEKNVLDDDYPEDSDLDGMAEDGVKFHNDAAKLGSALGGKPGDGALTLGGDPNPYPSSVAAHHLIPGNAALKPSNLFQAGTYLRVDGMAKGNIGYNVNSGVNGVWLPGNYAQRPWGPGGAGFTAATGKDPQAYAFASIAHWRAQFHDAHEDYSKFVVQVLNEICDKLDTLQSIWCPEARQKEDKPEDRNLYAIVNRLNTVSARMKRMLVFPTTAWKRNIFTSRFSSQYMSEKPPST